jgi:hypothetical protein
MSYAGNHSSRTASAGRSASVTVATICALSRKRSERSSRRRDTISEKSVAPNLGLSRHTELILRLDLLSVISRFLAAELPKTRVIAASYRAQQPRPGGPATLATP